MCRSSVYRSNLPNGIAANEHSAPVGQPLLHVGKRVCCPESNRPEFGTLKHRWAPLPLPCRRIERVALHVDLTVLARLAVALRRRPSRSPRGVDHTCFRSTASAIRRTSRAILPSRVRAVLTAKIASIQITSAMNGRRYPGRRFRRSFRRGLLGRCSHEVAGNQDVPISPGPTTTRSEQYRLCPILPLEGANGIE